MDKILNWGWKVKSLVRGSKNTYLLNTDEYHIIEGRSTIAVMGQEWAGGNAEANANLIAAAPDMYEALKGVAKAYKCSPTSMQPLFWLRCVQALAKCEGK